jgi:hypothetical protein
VESFGQVKPAAMACGTPIVACQQIGDFVCGSIEEIIDEDVTGKKIIADDNNDLINKTADAIQHIFVNPEKFSSKSIRGVFDTKWSAEVAAKNLNNIYKKFVYKRLEKPNTDIDVSKEIRALKENSQTVNGSTEWVTNLNKARTNSIESRRM